ncbi:DNA (cytosine-5-)-methyltransferase [Brucella intermedia]|uniref:Cytosine-specific methyltransferase n=1 Tax=Brucella intermedia M86 TaxID=1234597 RepID=M5K518_9HYPH|nr:DNA cytosine methyltransferase [Brucella intermedia]ELT51001.1 DNA-cytosine methyltransferase [Brucella intermedia M86]
MRIWIERQVGLLKDTPGARKFPGTAHEFIDCTDVPAPSIVAGRPVHIVIEDDGKDCPMTVQEKPPYRVPLMSEVAAMPWNGFNVISTFAGCGGSSTGYRMAGFRVLFASEFIEAARETYQANARPGTIVDGRDIRQVSAEDILAATGLKPGELDVLDGSPPCASFSTAGKREKAWGKVKKYSDSEQRVDDLFFEYARLVRGLRPKVFVAENVSGLVKGTAKGYFLEILAALKACGYRVEARLLDAQWLGVPQARQRLIFVGVREDLGLEPVFPKPLPYRYSIRDALPWLTRVVHDTSGQFGAGEVTDRPSPAITVGVNSVNSLHFKVEGPEVGDDLPKPKGHKRIDEGGARRLRLDPSIPAPTIMAGGIGSVNTAQYHVEAEADISGYAIGEEWDKLKPGGQSERYFQLVKPDASEPSPTITAAGGTTSLAGVTHPTEKRKFSIAELRRIGGFPDDFILTGTYAQQWERIGRAVPPVMMKSVAETVRDEILAKIGK